MSSKAHAERLARALEQTDLCQSVNADFKGDQIRLLLRVAKGAEEEWTKLIDRMLMAQEAFEGQAIAWQSHICKHYFRKEMPDTSKKLVFGWYISVQSNSMSESLDMLIRGVKGSLPRRVQEKREVDEMPLGIEHELNPDQGNGKGAWPVGGKGSFRPPARR